ncbi:MAG: molecular chaperone DnaJ [Planctomycetes bacterium]|jgi:molecular chaperone DnaJ|nr:molecular chaperone DnaJ [Planctomycetota bacterium]
MSEKRDYYTVLGVAKAASQDDIKRAYRKKALEFHPDRNAGDSSAEEKFKEAAEAYDALSDEQKRARYDQFGHAAFSQSGGFSDGGRFTNIEDIFEAFGDVFGGGGGGLFGELFRGGRRSSRGGPRAGRDLRIVLPLTLEEIDQGVSKEVSIKRAEHCASCGGNGAKPGTSPIACGTCGGAGQVTTSQGFFAMRTACPQCQGAGKTIESPCSDCRGQGRVSRKSDIQLAVPPGVEDGMSLRVGAEGDVGEPGGSRGHLYVIIREKEHKIFQRSGPDLITEVPFSFGQLTLGDRLEIPTLRGKVEMSIPAGTQSGKVFRLRGQGMAGLEGRRRGDQLVRVFIETPVTLTERQEDLLREFEDIESEKSGSKTFFEKIVDYFN